MENEIEKERIKGMLIPVSLFLIFLITASIIGISSPKCDLKTYPNLTNHSNSDWFISIDGYCCAIEYYGATSNYNINCELMEK